MYMGIKGDEEGKDFRKPGGGCVIKCFDEVLRDVNYLMGDCR